MTEKARDKNSETGQVRRSTLSANYFEPEQFVWILNKSLGLRR